MNKYDFIGQVKFYDYRVNHFGYLTVYNPTNILNSDSLRITENSLVDEPNLYCDNSIILFNVDSVTKIPKDVVLIDSLLDKNELSAIQNVVKKTLGNINFSELDDVCSRLKINIKDKIQQLFKILSVMKIDQAEVKYYYNIIEKYYSIDESLLYFFNNDKNHFKKIILSVPDHISNLNDQQRILYITKTEDIKIIDTLLKDWNFGHIATAIKLVKYLTDNNLESSVIKDFINQLKKKFNDFNFTEQFNLADYLKDKKLVSKAINGWSFPNDNETIDLLNMIVEKEIDSSGIEKFIKELDGRFESFNNDLQVLIIKYINDIDFLIDKMNSTENEIINNNFDFILDWIEERSSLFIEKKTIRSRLKKEILNYFNDNHIGYLKEFCDRKSISWLLNDDEIMELWSFDNINDLENFTTFFFNSEISEITIEMDEKITSIILKEVNYKSLELAMKWYEILNDKFVTIKMMYEFTINKVNYQRALYGEKYLTLDETTVTEIFTSHFDQIDDLDNDAKYMGLISFWDVILGGSSIISEGKPPDKFLMVSWFQRDDIPEPLQLIFLKALIFSINLSDGLEKLDVANYINEFPFTDLSAKLLMILIKNRKSTGMGKVSIELNEAFYKSLIQNDENPYIGYSMKHCNKRKYYAGDIHYDSRKKVYSFNGGFYLKISDYSPDQYALEFNENSSSSDESVDDDIPLFW